MPTATTASRWSGRCSLDLALELIGPATVVVPGHGAPVDRDFVQEQRAAIGVVAAHDPATWPAAAYLSARRSRSAQWPYPSEQLGNAVRRGYEQLPRMAKRLPLI